MLEIWGRKSSSNVQALMWCVEELGLAYNRHDAGHIYGVTDTDAFYDLNPNRTVPVLRDDGGPALWETGAILRYLAGKYGNRPFWPDQPDERAQVDKWAEWAKLNIAAGFTGPIFWGVVRTPKDKQDPKAIKAAVQKLNTKLQIAEQRLQENKWLCGDDFTLADIQFGHILYRYFDIEITRPDWPAITRYYDRLLTREAYQKHVTVSYEELRNAPPK
ncbi:MAG: glutathione S-transferase family protein [Pikeienuella sp.]